MMQKKETHFSTETVLETLYFSVLHFWKHLMLTASKWVTTLTVYIMQPRTVKLFLQ